ncbi:hypothetical protein EGW08_014850, partial [Elysia chlorotica]
YVECLTKLCSKAKLDRDRGFNELQSLIQHYNVDQISEVQNEIQKLLENEESSWESRHGGLSGARCLFEQGKVEVEEDNTRIDEANSFAFVMIGIAMQLLDDEEFRVRIAAGELLGVLCKAIGTEVYDRCKDQMLGGIRSNLERHGLDEDSTECQNEEPESIMYGSPATSSRLIEK